MKTEKSVPERCEIIQKVQRVLGGKWKIEILYYIGFQDIHRFGALRRHIGGISESSLINQLRSLEEDGFISRHDYKELPPRVEYSLTDLGQSFMPIMEHIKDWGRLTFSPYPHPDSLFIRILNKCSPYALYLLVMVRSEKYR